MKILPKLPGVKTKISAKARKHRRENEEEKGKLKEENQLVAKKYAEELAQC